MKIKLNDNFELVQEIKQKIKENDGYCPCQIEKSSETKCICKNFKEQKELGECHCGLYIKEEI